MRVAGLRVGFFLVAVLAQLFAAQANIKDAGLGYAARMKSTRY